MSKANFQIAAAILAMAVCWGCSGQARDEEAIRAAINARVASQSNLNTSAFETDVQKIDIHGDRATADVVFRVKGGPGQMQLTYNLTKTAGKWTVAASNPITFSHSPADPAGASPEAPSPGMLDSLHNKLGAGGR